MATIILDAFTGADGTNLTAHAIAPTNTPAAAWLMSLGNITIQSNAAKSYAGGSRYYLASGASDCVITATVQFPVGSYTGFCFRLSDATNYWWAILFAPDVRIYEVTGGVTTLRANTAHVYTAGVNYALTLTLSGTSISATADGATVSYTSAVRQTIKNHGLVFSNLAIADNFQIDAGNAVPVIMDYYRRRRVNNG